MDLLRTCLARQLPSRPRRDSGRMWALLRPVAPGPFCLSSQNASWSTLLSYLYLEPLAGGAEVLACLGPQAPALAAALSVGTAPKPTPVVRLRPTYTQGGQYPGVPNSQPTKHGN
jgi:hypothetical protein